MCGINGFNFINKKILKRMNDSLKHRGPNSEDIFEDKKNKISLGHRRLKIIDLSEKGGQPMSYSHKKRKVIIVYNGEIYNFLELKKELRKKGYKFENDTDTEVILASYIEWGKDCVNRFNGMWAFCIYDLKEKILFLSRDRIGKKPLHYHFDSKKGVFIFSSELKGILRHKINKKLDEDSIDFYFSLGFIPAPWTIYRNIRKLEARQNLIFDLKRKEVKKEYYYDWPDYSPTYNKRYLIDASKELISDSVKKRLISDAPLGAFLSGGLDSSIIVKEMSKFIEKDNLNTYSIGFEDKKFDESKYIKIIKNFMGTKHHHKYFREKDFIKTLKEIFYYYDEPFSDPSMFPTFFLSEFTREELTVALSGDGGDEVFGGYPRYVAVERLLFLKSMPNIMKKFLSLIPSDKLKEGLRLSYLKKEEIYSGARSKIHKPRIVKELLKKTLKKCLRKSGDNLQEALRLMDIYFYTLPENFLLKVDRASMAHGLEVRCPFLDYRIVEFSMKIPSEWKCSKFNDKIFFREIIKDSLPKKVVNRKKTGFTPPLNEWINNVSYRKELKQAINSLNRKKILNKGWGEFYNQIMDKNDLISSNYKIRLFLFYKWYQYWF